MKTLLTIIALVFITNTAYSQLSGQAKIDSLLKELPKMKQDTNGVNLLFDLSAIYSRINPDEGLNYGKLGLDLAKKLSCDRGKAMCFSALAQNTISKSDFPKAIEYFKESLKICEKMGDKSGIANNLGNIGVIYADISDFPKALEYHSKALKIYEELGDKSGISVNLGNMGNIYHHQSNYPKSLEYYLKALKMDEELGRKSGILANLNNIGHIYSSLSEHLKALEYYQKSLQISEELEDKSGIALGLGNIGIAYYYLSEYEKALEYYLKSLKIEEEIGNKRNIAGKLHNIGAIYSERQDYPKALEYYLSALEINEEINNKIWIAQNLSGLGVLYFHLSQDSILSKISERTSLISLNKDINLNKSIDYFIASIKLFEEIGAIDSRSVKLSNLAEAYEMKGDYKKAYEAYKEHKTLQDSIFSNEKAMEIANLEAKRENELKDAEIELLVSNQEKQVLRTYSLIGGLVALAIIIGIIFVQRKKSEKLLLNILPVKIAKRLKRKEENIADDFENATTIFIDLVGFTSFAKDKKASEVVKVLNKIFHRFDDLVNKHGLEKIKTMGDGYLAVAGVPEPDTNHCQKAVNFALEVRKEIEKFNNETGLNINARIGLETGPLVAGVIGSSKFIYDIWGDSVNTASRMESTGTPGKIQITENVKNELEKQTTNLQFEKREAFEVKGKGIMHTYFLEN